MPTTYVDSKMMPIGKFLQSASAISVPTFQRDYAWTEIEVAQLWTDLKEAMMTGQREYFLGPMVLQEDGNKFLVIDGQQRIATIYILLSIIRRLFQQNGDDRRSDILKGKFFGEQDEYTLDVMPKFHMNDVNDLVFQKHIVVDSDKTKIITEMKPLLRKDSNFLLFQAILTIWDLIEKYQIEKTKKDFDVTLLLDIQKYLSENVYVLFLTVKNESAAYTIFETLNDRGKELDNIDLLKNHLFGKADGYLDQVKTLWGNFRDTLHDVDPLNRFLYHYWTSINGRTSKQQLFRLMRIHITDPKSSLDFLTDMNDAAKAYSAFYIAGHPFWNSYDQHTRDNLKTLQILGAQQALPILLAAISKFDIDEFRKLTNILVTMAVRYNLIGQKPTGIMANNYVEIPPKIRSGVIKKSIHVFHEIKPIYPSDDEFLKDFSKRSLTDTQRIRYILSEIEKFFSGGTNQIVEDPKKVNIEHIFPKNPSQEWQSTINSISGESIEKYIDRIGNLALVSSEMNKGVGSKGFIYKQNQSYCKEEKIHFTHLLIEYSSWLKSDIDDRQKRLGDEALKIWRIDIK